MGKFFVSWCNQVIFFANFYHILTIFGMELFTSLGNVFNRTLVLTAAGVLETLLFKSNKVNVMNPSVQKESQHLFIYFPLVFIASQNCVVLSAAPCKYLPFVFVNTISWLSHLNKVVLFVCYINFLCFFKQFNCKKD